VAVAPAPASRSKTWLIVTISLAFVLLMATGIMTTLFVVQKNQTAKANDTINNLSTQVNSLNSNNENLQKQLTQAQSDLKDAQNTNDQTSKAKQALAACLNAIEAAGQAQAAGGTVPPSLITDLNNKCNAAQQYL
jgi:uncharacterized protein YlxW (UPF0749 family)